MDREILLEYLSRLLFLIAENREYQFLAEVDAQGMSLVAMKLMPQPHMESSDVDRYRLHSDERRRVMLGHTVDNVTRALCYLRAPDAELAPHELVAQDLVAMGRVREALSLCGRATSDVYAAVRMHRVIKLARSADLIDADEELFLTRVVETWC